MTEPNSYRPWVYPVSLCLWVSSLSVFLCVGLLYVLLSFAFKPATLQPVARLGCRGLLLFAGQRLVIEGSFPPLGEGPYIYMYNHSSLLDTYVLMGSLPEYTAAVGKKAQFEMPLWGWVLKRWGAVPIDRSDLDSAINSLGLVEKAMTEGRSLLIAPEGTRSADGRLAPFKKGPFHIAMNTKAPIIPMAIDGAYKSKHKGSWVLRPGVITLRIGPPLVMTSMDGVTLDGLRAETRLRLEELLGNKLD